eukprot:tig00021168_g19129.t1
MPPAFTQDGFLYLAVPVRVADWAGAAHIQDDPSCIDVLSPMSMAMAMAGSDCDDSTSRRLISASGSFINVAGRSGSAVVPDPDPEGASPPLWSSRGRGRPLAVPDIDTRGQPLSIESPRSDALDSPRSISPSAVAATRSSASLSANLKRKQLQEADANFVRSLADKRSRPVPASSELDREVCIR